MGRCNLINSRSENYFDSAGAYPGQQGSSTVVELDPDCIEFAVNTQMLSQNTTSNTPTHLGHQWANEVGASLKSFYSASDNFWFGLFGADVNARTTSAADYGKYFSMKVSVAQMFWKTDSNRHAFQFDIDPLSYRDQYGVDIRPSSPKNLRDLRVGSWAPSAGISYMYRPAHLGIHLSAGANLIVSGNALYNDAVEETTETNGKKETKTVTREFSTKLGYKGVNTKEELFYAPFTNNDSGWLRNTRFFIAHQTQLGWWGGVGANSAKIQDSSYSSSLILFGLSTGYFGEDVDPVLMGQ